MTTRLKGFTVALEKDIREDDAEPIREAILALRHVAEVKAVNTDGVHDFINRAQIRREFEDRLWKALEEKEK